MAELDFLNGTPTAPGETEFDAWLRDRNQKSALRASTVLTAARTVTTPEEVAKRRSVAALAGSVLGTNLPARLLTDPMTLQMVENKVISTRALDTLRKNPLLAEWFSDQDNAAIASTDVEELGLMSQVLYGVARGADKFYDDLVGPGANFRTTAEALSRARDSQRTYTELLAEERAASAGGVEPVGGIAGARVAAQKASGTVPKTTDEDATNPFASARAMKRWLDSRIYGVTSFNDQEDLEGDNAEAAREMLREEVERQEDFPIGRGAAEVSRKMAEIPAEAGFLESTKAVFDIMTERPGDFVGFLAGTAAESGVSLIAAAGVTAATRNPALGRVAMFGTAVPVVRASNTLEMASEMGYDLSKPEDARRLAQNPSDLERIVDSAGAYATVVSMVDALTAGLGSAMVKNPVGSFAIEAISQAVAGGGGEILARMVSGQQWSWTDAILEGLAEMATAPLEAMGVGSEVVFRKYRESQRASDRRGFFQALSQGSADSALRKRSPEAYKSAIEKLTKDGPVENVYVDAGHMEQLFQDDPEALRALFDAVPDLDYRAFQKAAETGSVFAIPTATYAANIAGTEIDARLTDHLRLRPDRLSYAEAQEAMAETEEQMKGFEKRLKELEETADLDPAAQQEYEDLTTQLIAAGRAPGVARAEAQLLASTVQTMAQRQGVTTAEYVRRNLLPTIRRETSTAEKSPFRVMRMGDLSEALRDPSRATLPEFAAIADELAEQNLTPETASEDDIRLAAISVADRGGLVSSLDEEFLLTPSGIYRATPGEPMMQTVSLRNGTEDLSAWGHTPGKSITTRALALIMQARQRALYGKIKRTDFSQKTIEKMANWMADEIEFELQTPGATAEGWYTTKFQAALDVMTARFPEFDTSVEEFVRPNLPGLKKVSSAYEARQLMTMIIAVTSNGAKVTDNFRMAVDAYRQFRETGRFRDVKNAGDRASSITSHLNRIAQLIGEFDSVSEVQAFLTEDVTVSDLNKQLKAIGMPVLSKMPSDARVPRATAIFGPKLGAFYANLTGADGYLTMDLWWSRTINRYRGDVLPRVSGLKNAVDSKGKPIGLHRFKWLVGQPDLTDGQALKLVVDHAQRYKDRGYEEGDEAEKAANTLYKDAFVKLQESPLSAKERAFMIEVAGAARDEVYARTGKRYSVADIQALIWYYEKRLMADMGARESGDISYEEAARRAIAGPGGDVFAQGTDGGGGQGDGAGVSGAVSEGDGDVADRLPDLEPASPGPVPRVRSVASSYMKRMGLPVRHQAAYVKVDKARAEEIARLYDEMPDAPDDPEVQRAYQALAQETIAQYDALLELGFTFEWITGDDPYATPAEAIKDMQENKHLWVFPTDSGFGTLNEASAKNPLLAMSGRIVDGREARINDLFRIVHDVFGHGSEGASFGARGEENAWQAHVRMFSPLAARAMTTETRGQNSWVNFGPYGEQNRKDPKNTVFADQKVGLLPPWVSTIGQAEDVPNGTPYQAMPDLPEGTILREDGQPLTMYHGTNREFTQFRDGEVFLTSRRGLATEHALREGATGRPRVIEATVALQNPLEVDAGSVEPDIYWLQNAAAIRASVAAGNHDGVMITSGSELMVIAHRADQVTMPDADPLYQDGPGSSAFDKWFGDSKVVDEDGNPLVVYHGTDADFEAFDLPDGMSQKHPSANLGVFFTSNAKTATEFAGFYGARIMPTYLRIENPYEMTWGEFSRMFAPRASAYWDPVDQEWEALEARVLEFKDELTERGHDGIRVKRSKTSKDVEARGDTYVVFDPTQIKSVFNRGTFDPNDPRILYQGDPASAPATPADFEGELMLSAFRKKGWFIASATQSHFGSWDSAENVAEAERLREFLRANNLAYREVRGRYAGTDDGPSFLVFGDETTYGQTVRSMFRQESILTRQGFVYSPYEERKPVPITGLRMGEALNPDEDYQTTLPDGRTFTLDLDWPDPKSDDPRDDLALREDGKVELIHWSPKERATIDPKHAGKGKMDGPERHRSGPNKAFYGLNIGARNTAYRRESPSLGGIKHTVALDPSRLYPWDTDPDGLRAKIDGKLPAAQQIGAYEKAIKKAGYAGYFVIDGPLGDVAAVFEALPVEKVEVDTALYQSDEAFFKSALAEAIRDAKQETAPVKDWLKIIPKMPGVKKAELEWTGLTSWLESQDPDRKLTRQHIYHWLSSELVQIERVDGSGAFASYTTSLAAGKVEKDTLYDEILLTVPNLDAIGPNAGKEIASTVANRGHFDTPNIVVHARVQATEDTLFIDEVQSDLNSFWRKRGGQAQALAPVSDEVKAEVKAYEDLLRRETDADNRVRTAREAVSAAVSVDFTYAGVSVSRYQMYDALFSSSRTLENLARTPDIAAFDAMLGVLLQRQNRSLIDLSVPDSEADPAIGRAARGASSGDLVRLVREADRLAEARAEARDAATAARRALSPAARDLYEGIGENSLPLPLTPFEGESAITLAMKYLTTYAAREGFKKIAWTPGYMQMKRWGVQEQRAQGMIQRWVVTGGRDDGTRILTLMLDNGQVIDISYDTAGVVTRVPPAWAQLNAEGRNLREIVPQAMADIAMRPIPEGETIVAGDGADLPEVNISDNAGQGYRIVYDQQMKRFLEKWAGKFGGKVESDVSVTRDTGEDSLGPRVAAYREEWRNREGAGLSADSVRRFINAAEDFGMATEGAVREMRIAYDGGDYGRAVDLVFRRLTKRGVRQVAQQIGDSAFFPDEGQPVWSITLTDEFRAEASKPQPLFQGRPTGARGQIILPPAGSDAAPEITLFDRADLSTVIHEGGHWMLWLLQTGANAGDQFSSESMETVKAWLASQAEDIAAEVGLIGPQVLEFLANGTTGAADVDAAVHRGIHERFARGFEAYMREGKAPSIALRGVFHRFAAWLMEVYRNAKKLRVDLSDEVRQVFDKMIATDAQIAQARQLSVGAEQIAATARAMGLDEASYAELVRLQDEERAEAFGLALRETLAPIMAQRSKEMRALRAELTKKISAEVNAQRHNRAFEWLANGRWSGVADVPDDLPADLRMDPETLGDEYGQDVLDKLPRGRRPMTKVGGITADEAAGWFGYDSGAEMLRDLTEKPRARDEIKQRVQAALAEHIEAQDPRDAAEATADLVDALHGEKHGQVLAAELRAINRISNRKRAITSRQQAAQIARDIIARTPVREAVRADLHARQAQTFGEQAARLLVTGDTEGAFEAKRKQLIQHSLFVESRKAADLMAKAERKAAQLKRPGTRKNLAGEYLEAIDDLLYTYDFRKISAAAEKKRGGLLRYIEMMVKAGRENELAIPDHLITNANRTPYKTLTVQRLQGVLDALTNIEHTARLKKKLLDRQRERDMDAVVADIQEAFDENVKGVDLNRVPTGFERVRDAVKEYVNYASNADTLLRRLDGWKLGDVYRHIKSGIDRASSEEVVMRLRAGAELDKLFDGYSRGERRRMAVRQIWKGYDQSLSKWDLISIALNSGNKDNWERMTSRDNPHAISPAQAKELLSNLDERDWKFVQSVWDHLDAEYWPQIAAREKRTTGVVPKKVEAMFMASDIPNLPAGLTGGYYPIVYDRRFSAKVAEEKHQEIQTAMQAGRFGKAQTRNGHTKERAAGSGGRTVELGIHVLFGHVHQVIHDLALSEEVANSWKILQDPRVRGMFERAGLLTDLASLEVWLQDTAAGQIVAAGVLGRMARHAKSGFTVSKLAFNMSTVAIQFTGLVQSAAFLGKRDLVKGYSSYVAQGMYPAAQRIKARSVFMAERERTFQRDMFDLIGETAKTPISGSLADARDLLMSAGFWAMQKVQFYVVDVPTWMAAHGQARKRGMTEDEAVHYADRAVARAQASGVYADRTAIERGTLGRDTRQNEFLRLFTALGSYMFAKFNIAQEIVGRTRRDVADPGKSSIAAVLNGTIDMLLLFTVEAVLYHMIKGTLPGDDEDEDEQSWLAFLASQTALSAMGTLPFIRDMVSVIQGFDGGGAYGGVIETVGKPLVQIGQGEVDKQLMRSINDLVGLAVPGYPSTAIWRLADAEMERQSSGNFSPLDYIMGVPR